MGGHKSRNQSEGIVYKKTFSFIFYIKSCKISKSIIIFDFQPQKQFLPSTKSKRTAENHTLTLLEAVSGCEEKLDEQLLSSDESTPSRRDPFRFRGRPFRFGAKKMQKNENMTIINTPHNVGK